MKMNHEEVMQLLPHRDPMLLVDTVEDVEPLVSAETRFHVKPEWDIFRGHFPGDPVLPGVLSVEVMAQAADIVIMTSDRFAGMTPLFGGINSAKFRRKIVPGDTLTAKVKVVNIDENRNLITCAAELLLGEDLAAKCEVVVAMR